MGNDCWDWELERDVYEIYWKDPVTNWDESVVVHCEDEDYAIDRAWEYCQNNKTGPKRKEDLKLRRKRMLL